MRFALHFSSGGLRVLASCRDLVACRGGAERVRLPADVIFGAIGTRPAIPMRAGRSQGGLSNETRTTKADDGSDRHLSRLLQRAAAASLSVSCLLPALGDARRDPRTRRARGIPMCSGPAPERAEAVRAGRRGAAAQRIGRRVTEGGPMGIAATLRAYLDRHQVPYELLHHAETRTTTRAAKEAHVPGDRVAKPVVIEDADRYIVVVIPATQRIDFTALRRKFGRQVGL